MSEEALRQLVDSIVGVDEKIVEVMSRYLL